MWHCKGHKPLEGADYQRELEVTQRENLRLRGQMTTRLPINPEDHFSRSRYPADAGRWEETPYSWIFHSEKPHSRLIDPTVKLAEGGPVPESLADRRITNIMRPHVMLIDDNWRDQARSRVDLGYNFYASTTFIKRDAEQAPAQHVSTDTPMPRRRLRQKTPDPSDDAGAQGMIPATG